MVQFDELEFRIMNSLRSFLFSDLGLQISTRNFNIVRS